MSQILELSDAKSTGFIGRAGTVIGRRTEGRGIALLTVIVVIVALTQPLVFSAYPVTLGRIALIGIVA